ncbi:MAG: sulfatase-like hydrolase/transferase, partial [Arenibacterium sp.]
ASDDQRPWVLYVGLVAPHFPLVVPNEFFSLYPTPALPKVKQHPNDGYLRHPWVEKQNAMMDSEAKFNDPEERLRAMASYYGLCTWLDHNIGMLLSALDKAGFGNNTTVIYTSDHGDNLGARGLWGKSNLYQESVSIPMIMAGPGIPVGTCDTPVSLLDLSATIPDHFDVAFEGDGRSLFAISSEPTDKSRPILSQYHAAGAVSGAFMLRKDCWKLNWYVGFPPELFDLDKDPEELTDLARDPEHAKVLSKMESELRKHVDPEAADRQAFADQADLIAHYGGREAALKLGAPAATPPPEVKT